MDLGKEDERVTTKEGPTAESTPVPQSVETPVEPQTQHGSWRENDTGEREGISRTSGQSKEAQDPGA